MPHEPSNWNESNYLWTAVAFRTTTWNTANRDIHQWINCHQTKLGHRCWYWRYHEYRAWRYWQWYGTAIKEQQISSFDHKGYINHEWIRELSLREEDGGRMNEHSSLVTIIIMSSSIVREEIILLNIITQLLNTIILSNRTRHSIVQRSRKTLHEQS